MGEEMKEATTKQKLAGQIRINKETGHSYRVVEFSTTCFVNNECCWLIEYLCERKQFYRPERLILKDKLPKQMTLDEASEIIRDSRAAAHKGESFPQKKLLEAFKVSDKEKGMADKSKAGPLPGWAELNAEKERYKTAIEEIWELPINEYHSTASRSIAFRAMNPHIEKKAQ